MIFSDLVGIIADDLTGANDTALQFHQKGASTKILLDSDCVPKIKAGTEIILSDIPTKDYCEFLGWDKEIPDYMPKYNFTLTAKWQNIKEDFIFSTNTIYKYIGNKLDVRIPRWYTIDGIKYEILNIAQNSFSKTKVNNVIILDGVLIIDDYAFYGADNLIEVKIPESINYIGKYAFANCKKLKNIILPKQINVIYENTFENCESLINVNLDMINDAYCTSTIYYNYLEHNKVSNEFLEYVYKKDEFFSSFAIAK